jgi:hypothetical protein
MNTMVKVIVILLGIFLVSCNGNNKNISIIETYIQSVESQNYSVMESMLDENYMGYGPSIGDSIRKPEALQNWKDNTENLYENIHYNKSRNAAFNIPDGENQGDWVSNWAELQITYQGGKEEVTIWANTVYQIEDEKIVKSYTFYNEADALRQLNYVFINQNDL